MRALQENNTFAQVLQKLEPQSKLLCTWELKGGVSAQVTALEVERPDGRTHKMIVRRHGEIDFKENPCIAANEFQLLSQLHAVGVPVPRPYYIDASNEIFPTPYIVIEYLEGKTEFSPANLPDFLLQFTKLLSRIHAIDYSQLDVSFLPRQAERWAKKLRERPAQVDALFDEGRARDILEAVWPLPQRNPPVLLHGDFWPGNLLWRNGELVAIIDWEDAAIGDPLADLANSRLEILWAFGSDAMQHFTQQYQSMSPIDFSNLPYWDLYSALRHGSAIGQWSLDESTEKTMREALQWFITQALEKLSFQ